ncbi:MAG: hypothetical protein ACRCWQ_02195 [Bacilli bacterium]
MKFANGTSRRQHYANKSMKRINKMSSNPQLVKSIGTNRILVTRLWNDMINCYRNTCGVSCTDIGKHVIEHGTGKLKSCSVVRINRNGDKLTIHVRVNADEDLSVVDFNTKQDSFFEELRHTMYVRDIVSSIRCRNRTNVAYLWGQYWINYDIVIQFKQTEVPEAIAPTAFGKSLFDAGVESIRVTVKESSDLIVELEKQIAELQKLIDEEKKKRATIVTQEIDKLTAKFRTNAFLKVNEL